MIGEGEVRQRFTLIASYHKQVLDLLQIGPQNWKSINICLATLPQLWNMHSLEKLSPLLYVNSPIFRKLQILHFYIQLLHIHILLTDEVKRLEAKNNSLWLQFKRKQLWVVQGWCYFLSLQYSNTEWLILMQEILTTLSCVCGICQCETTFTVCLSSFISL